MLAIKIVSILILVGSIVWYYFIPGFESGIAALVGLSGFIGAFIVEKKKATQSQKVEGGSVAIQSGRDTNINTDPFKNNDEK